MMQLSSWIFPKNAHHLFAHLFFFESYHLSYYIYLPPIQLYLENNSTQTSIYWTSIFNKVPRDSLA